MSASEIQGATTTARASVESAGSAASEENAVIVAIAVTTVAMAIQEQRDLWARLDRADPQVPPAQR